MNEAPKSVALVVVTHDSAKWLPGFVASWQNSVRQSRLLKDIASHFIVADSGSSDGTVALARTLIPEANIVECGDIGYGAAANRGVAAASTTWILLCNPDVIFPDELARVLVDPVLDELRAEPVWQAGRCIAPRLLNEDGTVQASVGIFPTLFSVLRDQFRPRQRRKYASPQPDAPGMVDWTTGACLLLRRDAFEAVGGFDEKFFLYVEEVDLQRRLWAAGHPTWFAPQASVIHHAPNAARIPRASVQNWSARGMLRYFARHGNAIDLLGYKMLALVSRRLTIGELMRSRRKILAQSTR